MTQKGEISNNTQNSRPLNYYCLLTCIHTLYIDTYIHIIKHAHIHTCIHIYIQIYTVFAFYKNSSTLTRTITKVSSWLKKVLEQDYAKEKAYTMKFRVKPAWSKTCLIKSLIQMLCALYRGRVVNKTISPTRFCTLYLTALITLRNDISSIVLPKVRRHRFQFT